MEFNSIHKYVVRKLHSSGCHGGKKPRYMPKVHLKNPRYSGKELDTALKQLRKAGIIGFYKQGKCVYLIASSRSQWERLLATF